MIIIGKIFFINFNMHQISVLIFGPSSFQNTLNELKPFLKFNHSTDISLKKYEIILFHDASLKNKELKEFIEKSKSLKICLSLKRNLIKNCDAQLQLPTTIKEINFVVETVSAKKKFTKNSSIKVKNYLLNNPKPVSKENILSSVWNYSAEADTHTVETHIYRLRKKINDKFFDNKFIFNNKNGYFL